MKPSAHVSTLGLALMTPLSQREGEFGKREVHLIVYADGEEIDCGGPWYQFGVHLAGVRPGRYWFANCPGCGEPGCVHIRWPAVVEHKGGLVHWHVPAHPSTRGVPKMPRRMRFDREQYRAECERLINAICECQELGQPGVKQLFGDGEGFYLDHFRKAVHRVARLRGVSKQRVRYTASNFQRDAEDGGYR